MIGVVGRVVDWEGTHGRVHVQGEIWWAQGPWPVFPDSAVRVTSRSGLVLTVEPVSPGE